MKRAKRSKIKPSIFDMVEAEKNRDDGIGSVVEWLNQRNPLLGHKVTMRSELPGMLAAAPAPAPAPATEPEPIPMLLWCPGCHQRHIDKAMYMTKIHHTHACQHCGMVWRPAIQATVGVTFLPGFKDET